jgi:hypothetical protein
VTIVRFENGEHLQDTVDVELVEQKMIEAVEAEDDNWLSCVMDPAACDFDRDVLPMVGSSRERFLRGILDQYLDEGSQYRVGDIDIRAIVDVRVNNQTPVVGEVEVCEIDSGTVFVPGEDGQPEEVLNNDAAGIILRYRVQQTDDGTLRVTARTDDGWVMGDTALCDKYLQ